MPYKNKDRRHWKRHTYLCNRCGIRVNTKYVPETGAQKTCTDCQGVEALLGKIESGHKRYTMEWLDRQIARDPEMEEAS